jgi:hypothetical protein
MGIVLNVSEISKMMTRFLRRETNAVSMMILTILVMLLSACNANTPAIPLSSPLGSPLAQPSVVLSYAKPSAGKGAATGRLVTQANGQEIGYLGGDLYLAGFLAGSKSDAPPIVSFSVDINPKAVVYQADGQFAFTDIAPGTYTLVVWNPATSFIVENPGKGAVVVVIEPDKVAEIGKILIP